MKCEKCHENEATYYYRETINGKTTEKRLCAHCAQEEGLTSAFDWRQDNGFGGFFEDFFGDVFSRSEPFFGGFFGTGAPLTRRVLRPVMAFPRVEIGYEEPGEARQAPGETAAGAPAQVDLALQKRRETEALRQQLQDAVEREDYEKAIELRDKLKAMEQK